MGPDRDAGGDGDLDAGGASDLDIAGAGNRDLDVRSGGSAAGSRNSDPGSGG